MDPESESPPKRSFARPATERLLRRRLRPGRKARVFALRDIADFLARVRVLTDPDAARDFGQRRHRLATGDGEVGPLKHGAVEGGLLRGRRLHARGDDQQRES